MRKFVLLVALTLLALMTVGAGQAFAATRYVNDDGAAVPPGTSCSKPGFNSIEAAVNASGPNDTVLVCPGTYPEIVTVDPGKDNLTVRSTTPLAAVIQAPPTIALDLVNFKSIVRITTSRNVSLIGFRITGPGPAGCDSIRFGVRVDGNGSANILRNHITEIRDTPFSGCQNGVAIQVGRTADGQTGQALIAGNRIDRYQKNGPTIDNVGSSAIIVGNDIQGIGPTVVIAQNGIQVSRGATAQVRDNRVRDHAYIIPANLPEFTATGILLFQSASTTVVERNRLNGNQDGIGIYTTTGNRIANNRVIGDVPSINPVLGTLTLGDGIYAAVDTSANRIERNFLRNNVEHDCHDDSVGPNNPPALVANFWINNDGVTQNKPGLCRAGNDGDDDDDDDDDDKDKDDKDKDDKDKDDDDD